MPFLREQDLDIPTQDLLSWYFDEPQYDLNKPIFLDAQNPDIHYTSSTAKTTIRQIIAGLSAAGFKNGDVVLLHAFNNVHYPVIVNSIVGAGGIFCGTNPSYTTYELTHAISTAKVSWFIVEPELLTNVIEACANSELPRDRIFVFDHENTTGEAPADLKSWKWLLDHGERDWMRFNSEKLSKDTQVARLFSSGTTGLPKAAVFNHWNFKAQHVQTQEWKPKPYSVRRLVPLPFFHVSTVPLVHFSSLRNGAQNYIMRRFDLESFLRAIEKYRITDIMVVPPVVNAIVNSSLTARYSLTSVRAAVAGGAPLDRRLQAELQNLLPPSGRVAQLWAMTETTCIVTTVFYPDWDDTGSVGWQVPGVDLKLVDDAGNEITGYDVRGEMCVRGHSVISGYLDNAEANKSWDADGFFHTGDIMYCDGKSKKWYVVDRRKELIKVRAFQVAPSELEAVLLAHPMIFDAAVIGIKAPNDQGEIPRAYVVKSSDSEAQQLKEQDVKQHVASRLARYKQLEGGVLFVDEIPRNPSGKILRRILRDQTSRNGTKL